MDVITLERIEPNPYQPREREDPEHVKKVALSIAEQGLLQVPVARIIAADGSLVPLKDLEASGGAAPYLNDEPGSRLQLAFGHTRLAAYKWLRDVQPTSNLPGSWKGMPVQIRPLTDLQMFEAGIGENLARKELTPIEEARAMQVYRDKFGKTSAEIGHLFGIGDSAVRNKMRLLSLPPEIQEALGAGRITEGLGRALLAVTDLPADIRRAADSWGDPLKPDTIVRSALDGMLTPAAIYERVEEIRGRFSPKLIPEAPVASKPAPAPAPVPPAPVPPAPVAPPVQARPSAPVSTPKAETKVQEPTAPIVVAEEAVPVSGPKPWAECSLTITITLWPGQDGSRMAVLGGRAEQDAPIMKMLTEDQLNLPAPILDLLAEMQEKHGG